MLYRWWFHFGVSAGLLSGGLTALSQGKWFLASWGLAVGLVFGRVSQALFFSEGVTTV